MRREYRRLLSVCFGLAILLLAAPATRAADADRGALAQTLESQGVASESLLSEILSSYEATPVALEEEGFSALSITLRPEDRERLLAAFQSEGEAGKAQTTFYVLAAGQQLSEPASPSVCIHAALSSTSAPYNYWIVVLNLGSQNVTRTTTVRLNGPGLKFNKSVSATYNAGGIWAIWYNPGAGVGRSGLYTFQGSVAGAGTFTIRSFAVNP